MAGEAEAASMAPILIPLATGIVTAFAGGVVAALITYSMNSNKEHVFLVRQKAEDLYLFFEYYNQILFAFYAMHYPYLGRKISLSDMLDMQLKKEADREPAKKTEMLINIYFPDLLKEYNILLKQTEMVSSLALKSQKHIDGSGHFAQNMNGLAAEFDREVQNYLALSTELKSKIIIAGRTASTARALRHPAINAFFDRIALTRAIDPEGIMPPGRGPTAP